MTAYCCFYSKKGILRRLLSYPHFLYIKASVDSAEDPAVNFFLTVVMLLLTELYFIYFIFNENLEKHVSYSSVSFLDGLFFYMNIWMMKGKM